MCVYNTHVLKLYVTWLFSLLLNQELSEDNLRVIERFIVLMYDRTSPLTTVNECRRSMFTNASMLKFKIFACIFCACAYSAHVHVLHMWSNFVLTYIKTFLYKLNDEVNAGVPRIPTHLKNWPNELWKTDKIFILHLILNYLYHQFLGSSSLYPPK